MCEMKELKAEEYSADCSTDKRLELEKEFGAELLLMRKGLI